MPSVLSDQVDIAFHEVGDFIDAGIDIFDRGESTGYPGIRSTPCGTPGLRPSSSPIEKIGQPRQGNRAEWRRQDRLTVGELRQILRAEVDVSIPEAAMGDFIRRVSRNYGREIEQGSEVVSTLNSGNPEAGPSRSEIWIVVERIPECFLGRVVEVSPQKHVTKAGVPAGKPIVCGNGGQIAKYSLDVAVDSRRPDPPRRADQRAPTPLPGTRPGCDGSHSEPGSRKSLGSAAPVPSPRGASSS